MSLKKWIILGLASSSMVLSGCAPVVLAGAGAGAVIVADKAAEKDGDEGLF